MKLTEQEVQALIQKRETTYLTPEQIEENIIEYVTFFRRNIDIFCEDFLEIPLHQFQKNMLIRFLY